ncbi:MAG: SMP-30/gluconolactonase/LRE family protein [Anaerolineales bacterium]|nr:SMP-30/gluconolactonase/LRE family protein [Anaerolineales bacterium]
MIRQPDLNPEGVEWDAAAGQFLVGSLGNGKVYAITDEGVATPLVEDDAVKVAVGIEVDAKGGRLLVCSSEREAFTNPLAKTKIALGIYDLKTGERLHLVDLTKIGGESRHFANDVAVDGEGNAYVTDSTQPHIYKVTPNGEASLFVKDARFQNPFLGLNGIVAHPDGYLLVALAGGGKLYKITLEAAPVVTEVTLRQAERFDGLILTPEGVLIGVSSGRVIRLESDDAWATATMTGEAKKHPATTVAYRDGEVYALWAHLSENPQPEAYELVRVVFP